LVVVKGNDGTMSGIPLPPQTFGVWGDSKNGIGVIGTSNGAGLVGKSQGYGIWGTGGIHGILGSCEYRLGVGVFGRGNGEAAGVLGQSDTSVGLYGIGPVGANCYGKTIGVISHADNVGVFVNSPADPRQGGIGVVVQSFYGISAYGYNAGLTAEA
jgi:hypothetical protein